MATKPLCDMDLPLDPAPRWAQPMWDAYHRGEIGWTVRMFTHPDGERELDLIYRRITPALAERWPELVLGRWVVVWIDDETGAPSAMQRFDDPTRLAPPRIATVDDPLPF